MIIAICDNCKKEFKWTHSIYWYERSEHHFCDRKCYYEWRKDITNHPRWNGGEVKMLGYVFVKVKDHPYANAEGYVKRSRYVMEQAIGRYIEPEEVIHHINEVRDDDRLENLMLCSSSSEHHRVWHKTKSRRKQLVYI
jgi:hypothetical protein